MLSVGKQYEKIAAIELKKNGLKIICTNYHCKYGEIDIIAKDKDTLVFVEVKYRRHNTYGQASEHVTPTKMRKLKTTAEHYLQKLSTIPICRFDVIGINGKENKIQWIKDAF